MGFSFKMSLGKKLTIRRLAILGRFLFIFCGQTIPKVCCKFLPRLMQELGITLKISNSEFELFRETIALGMVVDSRYCIFEASLPAIA